jgi:dual specificity tyrosine-phosphorylation-regulated kinase 2/3/4
MQKNSNKLFFHLQSSRPKKMMQVLSTIFESNTDFITVPSRDTSPLYSPEKKREKSFNLKFPDSLVKINDPKNLSPTSAMMLRTSSLSPCRSNRLEELYEKKKLYLPTSGAQAGLLYPDHLTEKEKKEIIKYSQVYFLGEKHGKKEEGNTDHKGRYIANEADHLDFRYEIISKLGKGSFGNVYKCFDHKRNFFVAVKVMRNLPEIREQAVIEIENLEKISKSDPDDNKCIVKMKQYFYFRGHACICFELLSMSLYQFLRFKKFEGLSKSLLKRIAVQILIGLRHIHDLGFIHCDLKPENILFKQENKSSIKIIDFGSASYKCTSYTTYIQSRFYRAPEIILGAGHSNKIDIWSFGCLLYELYSGEPLFSGENEGDQLIKIMQVLGLPPNCVIIKSKRRKEFFYGYDPIIVPNSRGVLIYHSEKTLDTIIEDIDLVHFLKKCLEWDADLRFSAEEALKHPWITKNNSQRQFRGRERS